jgi:hypothetical protein
MRALLTCTNSSFDPYRSLPLTADQADDHPWPPHAQPRRGAVAHLAEERIPEHRQQGTGPGDKCQAVRRLFDPDERAHVQ